MSHESEIDYTEEENEDGRMQDCVYATCRETDARVGPVWGHGDNSVKCALAQLSEECGTGAFHDVE